jgi:hypothetical protein
MGWLFSHNMKRRKDIIQDRIKSYNGKEFSVREGRETYGITTCLKHCYKGAPFAGTLWKVMETKIYNTETDFFVKTDLWIACDLLQWDNRDKCWGYKDLEESMGPTKSNCPLSYLDMVPEPDHEFAKEWRERVREYHKGRTPDFKPQVGNYVILREGWSRRGPFKLTSIRPLVGKEGSNRIPCKIPRRSLLRKVTRKELDKAKSQWIETLKTSYPDITQERLDTVDDDAIFLKHEFLFPE